jgi:hypothetical protein
MPERGEVASDNGLYFCIMLPLKTRLIEDIVVKLEG